MDTKDTSDSDANQYKSSMQQADSELRKYPMQLSTKRYSLKQRNGNLSSNFTRESLLTAYIAKVGRLVTH